MSRVEKYSRHKPKQQPETDLQVNHESYIHTSDEMDIPPRTKKYVSSKQKLTRFYYNLIFIFFIILVVALFIYGYKHTNGGI